MSKAVKVKLFNLKFGDWSLRIICDALHDLVLFLQFKKREKHLWRSVADELFECV